MSNYVPKHLIWWCRWCGADLPGNGKTNKTCSPSCAEALKQDGRKRRRQEYKDAAYQRLEAAMRKQGRVL
jgi:predicted nucleic acid-binding Zn ribbon protein